MFPRFSPLFEEQQEGQGGGGESAPAQTVLTLNDIKSLMGEFQANVLKGVDQKVNSLHKEFKTHSGKYTSDINSLKEQFASFRPREEEQQEQHEEEHVEEPQAEPQQRESKSGKNGKGERREEEREQQQPREQSSGSRGNKPYQPTPKELSLERALRELQAKQQAIEAAATQKQEEADKKEMDSLLRTELSKYKINSPKGAADLFEALRTKIVRGEDGVVYGPQGSTISDFVKNEFEERPFLHVAAPVNGSGAGYPGGTTSNGTGFDSDKISPVMTPQERNQGWAAISAAMRGSGNK